MDGKTSPDPYLDAGMRGFILKFARKNHWRVASWLDLDDLVQEGWLCYYKCRRRYLEMDVPDPTADDRRHMMALVRTAFTRRVVTLANRRTEQASECCVSQLRRDDAVMLGSLADTDADLGSWASAVIAGAPKELVDLVSMLVRDAAEAGTYLRDAMGRRETSVEHDARVKSGAGTLRFNRSRLRWTDGRVRMGRRATRETGNEFYCRLLGLDPRDHDLRGMIRDYLS